jgi:hypothetical protein
MRGGDCATLRAIVASTAAGSPWSAASTWSNGVTTATWVPVSGNACTRCANVPAPPGGTHPVAPQSTAR